MLTWMASWWAATRRARSTKAGMRQRRAQDNHLRRACLAALLASCRASVNTIRRPSLFQRPGSVYPGMGTGDPVQLGLLRLGQVLGLLPQRPPGLLQRLRLLG